MLSEKSIRKYLNKFCQNLEIEVFESIDSTNNYVRKKAADGVAQGFVAISSEQTAGRGRRGRKFYSPKDSGVYLSILLRPSNFDASKAGNITAMAAVAVCEAIETVSEKAAGIKWVNDVYMDGKKVSGILTEASFDSDGKEFEYVVLGIGVNIYEPQGGFDDSIKDIATAVFKRPVEEGRSKIAAEIINRFYSYYEKSPMFFSREYKRRSVVIGKEIFVITGDEKRKAKALEIDDECHLVVEYDDRSKEALSGGEISIRMKGI